MKQKGPVLSQSKGFAHILLILFLIVGLAVAVYLVQKKTNILPKAYEPDNAGIGSTAPMGIGSTAPVSTVPAEPSNLKLVKCSTDGTSAQVQWSWEGLSSTPIKYYVSYRKPDGGWWPNEAETGATLEKTFKLPAENVNAFDKGKILWGVRACNGEGSCSGFVQAQGSEIFRCPPALPVMPTRLPNLTDPNMLRGVCAADGTSAELSWNPVDGVNLFIVSIIDDSDRRTPPAWPIFVGNSTTTTVSTIVGHKYHWNVKSCDAEKECKGGGTTAYFDCLSSIPTPITPR